MKPQEQIECLLEYVKDIPKESWQYSAIWEEIEKLTPVVEGRSRESKDSERESMINKLTENAFHISKNCRYPSEFRKELSKNHIEIIEKKPTLV